MSAQYATHGSVAVITLDNPPVNGLGHALRTAIVDGLTAAQGDPESARAWARDAVSDRECDGGTEFAE